MTLGQSVLERAIERRNRMEVLEQQLSALQAKLAESEAAAGAMREVLKHAEWAMIEDGERYCVMCHGEEDTHGDRCSLAAALAPDAGKAVLERVRELEESLRWCLERMDADGGNDVCRYCKPGVTEFLIPGKPRELRHNRGCGMKQAVGVLGR